MASDRPLTPEERKKLIAAVEAEEARVEAEDARKRARFAGNVRQLRPRQHTTSQPTPIAPAAVTDEWESWWLPAPVQAWVDACAAAYCVPKVMPIAAALCAASLIVQGKAKVRIHEAWEEELSIYWLVFAPTGMAKSAVLKAAMAPVRALQRSAEEEMLPVIRERSNERARLEAQISRMRRATKAHRYSEGSQEHLQQLREIEHELAECEVPVPPEWLHTDANPTVIPRLMAHNLAAEGIARVAVCDAEGTFLANLLGRHSGHLNVDPLLAAYTGDPIEMVRTAPNSTALQKFRMQSSHMVMCLMVQPHYIDKLRAHPELGDNGWLGRCIVSRVERDPMPEPFRRPSIPDDVSNGYADWIAQLASTEPGTVFDMPAECQGELERAHGMIAENIRLSQGAVGWSTRSLGRICRIIALIELSEGTVETVEVSQSGPGGRACRVLKILTYLINTLYIRGLSHAQSLEPARHPLPTLARRALAWLRRFERSTVALRDLQRGLRVPKDDALAACDLLCETGHLELAEEKRRSNQTLTITYNVLSTDPDAGSRTAQS